jgi:hypothetical protein
VRFATERIDRSPHSAGVSFGYLPIPFSISQLKSAIAETLSAQGD